MREQEEPARGVDEEREEAVLVRVEHVIREQPAEPVLAAAVLGDEVLLGHEGGAGGGVLGRGRQVRDGGGEAGVLASLQ